MNMNMNKNDVVRKLLIGLFIAALPGTLFARDPGINQPGVIGGVPGAGAPGRGLWDPGLNQPGAIGNVGGGAPGVGVVDPGINQPGAIGNVGGGAPGAGLVDPGINQPGAVGNVGGIRHPLR
ncbi:hypothetical protein [Halochromatium sp.]